MAKNLLYGSVCDKDARHSLQLFERFSDRICQVLVWVKILWLILYHILYTCPVIVDALSLWVMRMKTSIISIGGYKGTQGTCPSPPRVQIISISYSFGKNLSKSYVGPPPTRVVTHTLGKSWIRYW